MGSGSAGGGDSPSGLKFGKKVFFESLGGGGSSSAAAGKRGKSAAQGGPPQPPRCQVEGCGADLTGSKAYYCRHKVCGTHSKSPKVVVAGTEQRFCQQCSRSASSPPPPHPLPRSSSLLLGYHECAQILLGPLNSASILLSIYPDHDPPFERFYQQPPTDAGEAGELQSAEPVQILLGLPQPVSILLFLVRSPSSSSLFGVFLEFLH